MRTSTTARRFWTTGIVAVTYVASPRKPKGITMSDGGPPFDGSCGCSSEDHLESTEEYLNALDDDGLFSLTHPADTSEVPYDPTPEWIAMQIMQSESMMWLMLGSDNWKESHISAIREGWNAYLAAGGKSWGKS